MTNGFVLATDPMLPPHGLEGAVYAIGNFDGLHLGHRAVTERAVAMGKHKGAPSALLTFEPHPADFFAGRAVVFRLTPPQQKAAICERLGLTGLVVIRFDASLAQMSAEEFIAKVLVERLRVGAVVVGWDFHFGKGRSGSPATLAEAGLRYGFGVEIVAKVEDGAGVVSSSAIRKALERGDLAASAKGLGRNYSVSSRVISGQRLGRTLGVPTANIALEPTNRLAHGVYAVVARLDGRDFPAVASFGTRPTVDDGPPLLEVHLLDFDGDLYGREMEVEFIERIRDERKFDSIPALVDEMARDKERARALVDEMALKTKLANCGKSSNASPPLQRTPNLAPKLMSDASVTGLDYSRTLFLPKTDFPMRAGLPQKEPEILARWARENLYAALRERGKGRPKFVLHDGPPYANGNVHIGTALNKTLKDIVVRAHQMTGRESNYVPGWDCHGLPIEWKVEEEFYRSKGKSKPDFSDSQAIIAFRKECRAYAEHWLSVQREEFKRLGVVGDWDHPYTTMSYPAEAQIAREIFKFVASGLLYRGSKPVMWSVVEKTALAEAEVEYEDHVSDTIFAAFPVEGDDASIVIWTTTPWTIPGNRAIAFSRRIAYGRYRVTDATADNWAKVGATYVLAQSLAQSVFDAARVAGFEFLGEVTGDALAAMVCAHPLHAHGYGFVVPLLNGDHVTEDAGTGFVHTAPGHGREDFELWTANTRLLQERGIDTRIPYTVDENGAFTDEAPGFEGKRVITDNGKTGDANRAVIDALTKANALIARGRLKHQYPHSWRSKTPVIFRNTPQWFLAMDRPFANAQGGRTLRALAIEAIERTRWAPLSGENRIKGMVMNKPDWVLSRQRAWGVPLSIFVRKDGHEILFDEQVNARIAEAYEREGADVWFAQGAKERFLGPKHDPDAYDKIDDLVEVWFDSGSTHAFVLEDPEHFPGLAGIRRAIDGGQDTVMYLEGSDQHRGWFQSSLLESCGTRGRAPFDIVLTHGFTLDESGRKMSKSLGNQTFPQDVIRASGADILRLWVASVDYTDDQRIGPEILRAVSDNYRKLRNTIRWMLGTLAHRDEGDSVGYAAMAGLERLMLHKLAELDLKIREAYENFDFARVVAALTAFMNADLSAFYFDIRKDALYCDAPSSIRRRGALEAIEHIFGAVTIWLAPILVFTAEEAWTSRGLAYGSIHLEQFPAIPAAWRDDALAGTWETIRMLRLAVTGAIEIARADKRIGSSLEAAPRLYLSNPEHLKALEGVDFAEVCITSAIAVEFGTPMPETAFRLPEAPEVGVIVERAQGVKCARSWRYFDPATASPDFPDVTPRDAEALRELKALGRLA